MDKNFEITHQVAITLFIILVILNIADVLLTNLILINGGSEANIIIDMAITYLGPVFGIVLPKLVPLTLLGYLLYFNKIPNLSTLQLTLWGLFIAVLFYISVIIYSCWVVVQLLLFS